MRVARQGDGLPSVARMSGAISGTSFLLIPACRFAHAGYLLVVLALLASTVCSSAEWVGEDSLVNAFFAAPLPAERSSDGERTNSVLVDVLRSSAEPTILLASDGAHASLLIGADRHGFGTLISLPVRAYGLHLSGEASGALWIGGYSKPHWEFYGRRTFAYLSKVDRQGHLTWEREFGGQTERRIQSMASLPSGAIAVSATDSRQTWLAKVSGNGDLVWERDVGVGKGSAVAAVGDVIVLAGIEGSSDVEGYREDVSVWSFGPTGEQLGHWAIREGINRAARQYTEDVQIAQSGDSLYIISKWGTFAPFKPLEITKFDLRTGVSWRKELPETINGVGDHARVCTLAFSALSNGDILTACRSGAAEIKLLRLSATNGGLAKSVFRLSAVPVGCDEPWSPASLMLEKSPGAVWLLGSPRASDENPCGWIGEIPSPAINQ